MKITDRTIAGVLVFFGVVDLFALAAAAMPFAWMRSINAAIGQGDLPDVPVVEYLARHVSLWYAVHAATFLFLATDVPRYRPVIRFLAWLGLAFAAALLLVNAASDLPLWWTLGQPLGAAIEPAVLFTLLSVSPALSPSRMTAPPPPLGSHPLPARHAPRAIPSRPPGPVRLSEPVTPDAMPSCRPGRRSRLRHPRRRRVSRPSPRRPRSGDTP